MRCQCQIRTNRAVGTWPGDANSIRRSHGCLVVEVGDALGQVRAPLRCGARLSSAVADTGLHSPATDHAASCTSNAALVRKFEFCLRLINL